MLRTIVIIVGLMTSLWSVAASESTLSLLDNRFRVDPTIEQITFMIYRSKPSKSVVLVRPDGAKYYARRHPDNVRWYQESSMDIISIDSPMPGPWQAVGKVTPKNNITLISNLKLTSDQLPKRMYQGEEVKFTARLTSDGKPLELRDFLDRVNLRITFTKYVEDEELLVKEARPESILVGEFLDDGTGFDEYPGDGIFTVGIKVVAEPGKYRVRILSGNGVFLRSVEQVVLVYPTPVSTSFIQARVETNDHHVVFTGDEGTIKPGSLMAHIEHSNAFNDTEYIEDQASEEGRTINLAIPNSGKLGNYKWSGHIYATELPSERPLSFATPEYSYSVVKEVDLEQARKLKEEALERQRLLDEEEAMIRAREEERKKRLIYIGVGNVVVIILGLIIWFVIRKIKAKKAKKVEEPEMQLNVPDE
ncbi:TIGR03503 family protein [Vibrio sp. RC27]